MARATNAADNQRKVFTSKSELLMFQVVWNVNDHNSFFEEQLSFEEQ